MQIEYSTFVTVQHSIIFALPKGSPEYYISSQYSPQKGTIAQDVRIDLSIEPLAIRFPVGSNRVAKTSPE